MFCQIVVDGKAELERRARVGNDQSTLNSYNYSLGLRLTSLFLVQHGMNESKYLPLESLESRTNCHTKLENRSNSGIQEAERPARSV